MNNLTTNLQKNQDGTLSGGYVSIEGGRFRVIIGNVNPPDPQFFTNLGCTNDLDCRNTVNDPKGPGQLGCVNKVVCMVN